MHIHPSNWHPFKKNSLPYIEKQLLKIHVDLAKFHTISIENRYEFVIVKAYIVNNMLFIAPSGTINSRNLERKP